MELELLHLINILILRMMVGQESTVTGLPQTKLAFLEAGD